MNASDINCTDNFTLLQGPRGDRGPAGVEPGPQGPTGAQGAAGPIGNSGASKIDLSFSSSTNPYVDVTSLFSFQDIGYFIFPGTNEFGTPSNVKFAASGAQGGLVTVGDGVQVTLKVEDITNGNDIAEVIGKFSSSGHSPKIVIDDTLLNLPTDQALFKITAKVAKLQSPKLDTIRVYAFELV
jgi:hypothetical protein